MACFSGAWLLQLLVWAIVLSGAFMIVNLWLSKIQLGEPFPTVVATIRIILYCFIAIVVVYFLYDLVVCALNSGPGLGSFGRIR